MKSLELGKLYFKIVDFEAALTSLSLGLEASRAARQWSEWCSHLPHLLRIYAERMDFSAIRRWQGQLAELEALGVLTANSSTRYTLGIAAIYQGQLDLAEARFKEALSFAGDPTENAQAKFGLAAVNSQRGQSAKALKQLEDLNAELKPTLLTDLKLATGLLASHCHRNLNQFDAAFALLGPLQETCRVEQNLYMSLNTLYCYGTLYQACGERARARGYFEMVQSLLAPRDLKHLGIQIDKRLAELEIDTTTTRTLQLIDDGTRTLITPEHGKVQFGNQFMLLSLLKILAGKPGTAFSKEDLTKFLWKEEYDPAHHDNKIYVTIRRLRQLIEADGQSPFYILSVPTGYMFNPRAEFRIHA